MRDFKVYVLMKHILFHTWISYNLKLYRGFQCFYNHRGKYRWCILIWRINLKYFFHERSLHYFERLHRTLIFLVPPPPPPISDNNQAFLNMSRKKPRKKGVDASSESGESFARWKVAMQKWIMGVALYGLFDCRQKRNMREHPGTRRKDEEEAAGGHNR